jgi:hypothetical protein
MTKAGTNHLTLAETGAADASEPTSPPSTIFTGHTMTRRAGPPARVTHLGRAGRGNVQLLFRR